MSKYNLAQLNIARLQAPLDSPLLADFVANSDRINALAEQSPGFVWRLETEDGNATAIRPFGDEYIVNLSVWQDVDSLRHFVFQTAHTEIMRRRKEWFERMKEPYSVLWWTRAGEFPSEAVAREKLLALRESGPSQTAFTFKQAFPPPGND